MRKKTKPMRSENIKTGNVKSVTDWNKTTHWDVCPTLPGENIHNASPQQAHWWTVQNNRKNMTKHSGKLLNASI